RHALTLLKPPPRAPRSRLCRPPNRLYHAASRRAKNTWANSYLTSASAYWRTSRAARRTFGQDSVDQAIGHRLLAGHEVVSIGVLADLIDWLAGMSREDAIQTVP